MIRPIHQLLGVLLAVSGPLRPAGRRDERGLSQSTESAILLAGANKAKKRFIVWAEPSYV